MHTDNCSSSQQINFSLQQIQPTTEIHTKRKHKEQMMLGCLALIDIATIQPLHLNIRHHQGRGSIKVIRPK